MIGKFKDKIELLQPDKHKKHIAFKLKRDIAEFRPDILHRCLLAILDSPLNKAGLLKVYIHTIDNVLIEVDPSIRIPRTENKFYNLMAQVIEKLRVRAVNSSKTLLKVVKNPVTDHLPNDCLIVGTSVKGRPIKLREYVPKIAGNPGPVAVVVGAVAKSDPASECGYVKDLVSISNQGLTASVCLNRIVNTFEIQWGIH